MSTLSRRTVLKGLAAGAGLAGAGLTGVGRWTGLPLLDAARASVAPPKPPGSLPNPSHPEGTPAPLLDQIEHVVVVMMENHSFDCYFGMLQRPGSDGFKLGRHGTPLGACATSNGTPVPLYHSPSTCQANYHVSQSWDVSHQSWNSGKNDGFVKATNDSTAPMAYWTGQDLPFYYDLARQFPLCDRYFASVMAQTYPNRRFLLAATALGQVSDPLPGPNDPPPPNGTIFDRLNAHNISWKDYFVDLPTTGLFPSIVKANPGKVVPISNFFADAAAGTLPFFSLVDPDGFYASEENPQDIRTGQFYASQVITAVMSSPAWLKTVLVFTYDEHGGYYDHVPPVPALPPDGIPPQVTQTYGDRYSFTGFRVPAVVVSPWARKNYVSHVVHDHTSILRLIETKWNLPALTWRDANASNLLDCLDLQALDPPFATPPKLAAAPVPTGTAGCFAADPHSPV